MSGWIVLGIYVAGFLATGRLAYPMVLDSLDIEPDEAELFDRWCGGMLSFLTALIWPLILVGSVFLVRPHRTRAQKIRQLQADKLARERRIRELERELGIGQRSR